MRLDEEFETFPKSREECACCRSRIDVNNIFGKPYCKTCRELIIKLIN